MKRANDPNDLDAVAAHYDAQLQQLRAVHGRTRGAPATEVELGRAEPLNLTPAEQERVRRFFKQHGYRPKQQNLTAHAILTHLVDAIARLVRIVAVSAAALFIIALALSGVPGVSR